MRPDDGENKIVSRCNHLPLKNSKRKSPQTFEFTGFFMAERVGFEPTVPGGTTDFEGRETAKIAHITAYLLISHVPKPL